MSTVNQERLNNLMPIGSVVLLKDASKRLMVIGILPKDGETIYDYIGVLYPEGYMNQESMFLFNHEDVKEISYIGFMNAEHQVFRNDLKDLISGKKPEWMK